MRGRVSIAVVVMGFSGLVAEILLLRELLIVFSGNELSIGIILANWVILEAFGCFFAGRMAEKTQNRLEAFAVTTILFSLFLIMAVFATRLMKSVLGISVGESVGLVPMFYSSFLILLPTSIFHGALFTFSCRIDSMFSATAASSAGRVYVYETVGTIIGGIVSTYLCIPYLNAFEVAAGLGLLNSVVCLVLLGPVWKTGLYPKVIVAILIVFVLLFGYLVFGSQAGTLHDHSIQAQWRNLKVVHYQNSEYGNICVVENEGQYIYFLDGVPGVITPVPDIQFVEEFVHLPLLAHPEPANILILSGGAGGVIHEALKHPSIQTIDYAELDPLLLSLFRKFPTPLTELELNDARVRIVHVDGRLLLRTSPSQYDLILVGIMEPSDLQANRFFTQEFFALVEERLNEGGILVIGAPGSFTFLNPELKNLNSCIFHTLSSVFSHIRVIPGDGANIFLASDSQEITTMDTAQIVARLNERNITGNVIVPWHIENKLHPGWQGWLARFLEGGSQKINYDFKPMGLFYSISHWNAVFAPSFGWFFRQFERIDLGTVSVSLVLMLSAYFILRSRNTGRLSTGIPMAILTSGFAGMMFSLIVVFTFQSIYGYVFSWIGLLVAAFMAGAACGAGLITRLLAQIPRGLSLFMRLELAIICLSVALPLVFYAVNAWSGSQIAFVLVKILFLVISWVCGLVVGSQFPLANYLYVQHGGSPSRTAGLLYASDLVGGWVGGIVGAVVLLPVLGLEGTCVTVGLLKLASLVVVWTQSRSASVRR